MPVAVLIVTFLLMFALVLTLVGVGLRYLETQRAGKVSGILKTASGRPVVATSSILSDASDSRPAVLTFLAELPVLRRLETTIRQAGLTWSPLAVVGAMAAGCVIGAVLGLRVRIPVYREFAMIALACLFGALPYLYVRRKRSKRLSEFEEQFPESLDFLARSMRAGHAFSVSLEMMSDESPPPVGLEFRQVFNEQNLGAPLDVALRGLAARVPLLDVRFFVSAVLMQRETGGNLAEILTQLGYVIRERFRLRGHVRAVSAHGRITATILSVMPIVTVLLLMIVAPEYLKLLAEDPHGKYLVLGAVLAQIAGYLWMKRIIAIKV